MAKKEKFYKILLLGKQPPHPGGRMRYPKYPPCGEWTPRVKGPLRPCSNGYHLTGVRLLPTWLALYLYNNKVLTLWLAEGSKERVRSDGKVCFRRVKLVKKLLTLKRPRAERCRAFSQREKWINTQLKKAGLR